MQEWNKRAGANGNNYACEPYILRIKCHYAPNENVAVDKITNKELGTYKTRTVTNEKGENVLTTDGVGAWTIFREGNPIVSFDGSTKPNASKPENFHVEEL